MMRAIGLMATCPGLSPRRPYLIAEDRNVDVRARWQYHLHRAVNGGRRKLTQRIGLSVGAHGRVPGIGATYANSRGNRPVTTDDFQRDFALTLGSELTPDDN